MLGRKREVVRERNNRLKAAIAATGKLQYEIADIAGISYDVLSNIVSGRKKPTEAEQEALSDTLCIKVEDLF